jgi:mRNA interferase HigB
VIENANSKSAFTDWIAKINVADWNTPSNIKETFNSADLLGKSFHRVVFDIGGNNYNDL